MNISKECALRVAPRRAAAHKSVLATRKCTRVFHKTRRGLSVRMQQRVDLCPPRCHVCRAPGGATEALAAVLAGHAAPRAVHEVALTAQTRVSSLVQIPDPLRPRRPVWPVSGLAAASRPASFSMLFF